MIRDRDFLDFIYDKDSALTKEELENIIDRELEKPEDIMDTDLIEYCLDTLNKMTKKVGDTNGNRINRNFKKIFAIAVAAVLLFVGAISASALVFKVNIFDEVVEFYEDNIRIHFEKSDNSATEYMLLGTALAQNLANNGISPVLLPEALISDDCKILTVEYEKTDVVTSANVSFEYKNNKGFIYISSYDSADFISHSDYLNTDNRIERITVSGIPVYIIEQNKHGTIAYTDNRIEYSIVTELTFEDAVCFAKTIK